MYRSRYTAHMNVEAVAASTPYVLVDLSDTTNFPHVADGEIHVLGVYLSTEKASSGIFDIYLGVITEVDATDGTAKFFMALHQQSNTNPTDNTDKDQVVIDFTLGGCNAEGVNLMVAGGATPRLVSSNTDANARWQTDVALASPVGTSAPGVGDLVMYVEEVTDGGTVDIGITVIYETG